MFCFTWRRAKLAARMDYYPGGFVVKLNYSLRYTLVDDSYKDDDDNADSEENFST